MEFSYVAVERSISTMWNRYSEPLSLAEMAETATFSKFYFSRVFRSVTGTSPGRFLTAIRLYRAKQLLLRTPLSVTDIAYKVGYNSLGTFTSRFTRSVCFSPARYRSSSMAGMSLPNFDQPAVVQRCSTVSGTIEVPETSLPVRLYVGAFPSPIVEGLPVACDILDEPGAYQLSGVPDGTWYIRAAAVALRGTDTQPWNRRPLFVGSGLVTTRGSSRGFEVDLKMQPMTAVDLPILMALPELDSQNLPELVAV